VIHEARVTLTQIIRQAFAAWAPEPALLRHVLGELAHHLIYAHFIDLSPHDVGHTVQLVQSSWANGQLSAAGDSDLLIHAIEHIGDGNTDYLSASARQLVPFGLALMAERRVKEIGFTPKPLLRECLAETSQGNLDDHQLDIVLDCCSQCMQPEDTSCDDVCERVVLLLEAVRQVKMPQSDAKLIFVSDDPVTMRLLKALSAENAEELAARLHECCVATFVLPQVTASVEHGLSKLLGLRD
jgi:hypothetical protein